MRGSTEVVSDRNRHPIDPEVAPAIQVTLIAYALLAVTTSDCGDQAQALIHIATAQKHARATRRRVRQVIEIAGLVVTEHRKRAIGLAAIHIAEFPDDADLLERMTARDEG